MKKEDTKNIILLGNPNSGKSSVFNHLTGLQQKVGNFAGVTVDKKTGYCKTENYHLKIIDLPGTYSLYPTSIDESVSLEILLNKKHKDYPHLILYILDANQIERHTLLLTQLLDVGFSIVVGINMQDIATTNGINLNIEKLKTNFNIPFVDINGRTGNNIEKIKVAIEDKLLQNALKETKKYYTLTEIEKNITNEIDLSGYNEYEKLLITHHSEKLSFLAGETKVKIKDLKLKYDYKSIESQLHEIMERYNIFVPKIQDTINIKPIYNTKIYEKIDNIMAHKYWGVLIFFLLMFVVFQAIFSWSAIPMDFIDSMFATISVQLDNHLPECIFSKLLVEGIIPGISGIVIFVPQIFILFFIVTFLEDIGYMSRAIYLFDNVMQKFGLNGRSIVALISGGACAIPAIMCTRTISNWKERLITILITPFISCSARIPVYALLIAFVVPPKKILNFLNIQGIVFMCLYLLGIATALISAYILKKVIKNKEQSYLLLELPSYKMPHWRNIGTEVWNKLQGFIFGAGKIILVISITLWFLASFGPNLKLKEAEIKKYTTEKNMNDADAELYWASKKLENSYAGIIGKSMEPIIQPLGFDWKIGIALVTSFAAREVFIGTISTLYSIGKNAENKTIQEKLKNEINPNTKEKVFTMPVALSLIIFYVFAMQCMSTLAIVRKETNSWKYPILQFIFMSTLAYFSSWVVFNIFR